MRTNLKVGFNLDEVNIAKGLAELKACGYDSPHTEMVLEHALVRWGKGEEAQAQKGAIDHTFHGVNLISWTRILAAAIAPKDKP